MTIHGGSINSSPIDILLLYVLVLYCLQLHKNRSTMEMESDSITNGEDSCFDLNEEWISLLDESSVPCTQTDENTADKLLPTTSTELQSAMGKSPFGSTTNTSSTAASAFPATLLSEVVLECDTQARLFKKSFLDQNTTRSHHQGATFASAVHKVQTSNDKVKMSAPSSLQDKINKTIVSPSSRTKIPKVQLGGLGSQSSIVNPTIDSVSPTLDSNVPTTLKSGHGVGMLERGVNWLEHESLLLFEGKKRLAEELESGSLMKTLKTQAKRWEFISSFLSTMDVQKTPLQCEYRWTRLWKPFKTIFDYERAIPSGQDLFWHMTPQDRVEKKLPRSFDPKIYSAMKEKFGGDRAVDPGDVLIDTSMHCLPGNAEEDVKDLSGTKVTSPSLDGNDSDVIEISREEMKENSSGKKRRRPGRVFIVN